MIQRVHIAMDESYPRMDPIILPNISFFGESDELYLAAVGGLVLLEDEKGRLTANGVRARKIWITPRSELVYHILGGYRSVCRSLHKAVETEKIEVSTISYCRFCLNRESEIFTKPFPGDPPMSNDRRLQDEADWYVKDVRLDAEKRLRKFVAQQTDRLTAYSLNERLGIMVCEKIKQIPRI